MVRAEEQITIARPPAEVFPVMVDVTLMPQWRANVAEVRWVADPPGEGRENLVAVTQLLGVRLEWRCDVTAFDVPHRFAYVARNAKHGYEVSVAFTCEAVAEGCRVTMVGAGEVPGGRVGNVAAPLYLRSLRRENRKSLGKLKQLVERAGP